MTTVPLSAKDIRSTVPIKQFQPHLRQTGPDRAAKIYLHTALTATAEIAGPQPISRLT